MFWTCVSKQNPQSNGDSHHMQCNLGRLLDLSMNELSCPCLREVLLLEQVSLFYFSFFLNNKTVYAHPHHRMELKGFRICLPQICQSGTKMTWSWGNGKKTPHRPKMNFLPSPICLEADYKSPCEGCHHATVPGRGHQPCHLRLQGTQKSTANLARASLSFINFSHICIFSEFATPKPYIPCLVTYLQIHCSC